MPKISDAVIETFAEAAECRKQIDSAARTAVRRLTVDYLNAAGERHTPAEPDGAPSPATVTAALVDEALARYPELTRDAFVGSIFEIEAGDPVPDDLQYLFKPRSEVKIRTLNAVRKPEVLAAFGKRIPIRAVAVALRAADAFAVAVLTAAVPRMEAADKQRISVEHVDPTQAPPTRKRKAADEADDIPSLPVRIKIEDPFGDPFASADEDDLFD